jgi:dolichyl-phosphate beta-glucosyltransferase
VFQAPATAGSIHLPFSLRHFQPVFAEADPLHALTPLSVIIPAYNGAKDVGGTVVEVRKWLTDRNVEHEIIVVDDGSTDQTARIAQTVLEPFGGRLLRHEVNRGKGAAVRTGMLAAEGAWALFLDVDHSTHIEHAAPFAEAAATGADVIVGSRRVEGALVESRRPQLRRMLGDLFPAVTRAIAGHGVKDSQCGFKAVKRWAIRPIFENLRTDRFAFDVEMLLRADRAGARIAEVPVRWNNPSQSTLRVARDGPRMLWDTTKAAWRLRRGGAEAMALGAAGESARAAKEPAVEVVTQVSRSVVGGRDSDQN